MKFLYGLTIVKEGEEDPFERRKDGEEEENDKEEEIENEKTDTTIEEV